MAKRKEQGMKSARQIARETKMLLSGRVDSSKFPGVRTDKNTTLYARTEERYAQLLQENGNYPQNKKAK